MMILEHHLHSHPLPSTACSGQSVHGHHQCEALLVLKDQMSSIMRKRNRSQPSVCYGVSDRVACKHQREFRRGSDAAKCACIVEPVPKRGVHGDDLAFLCGSLL
jgi:hypothetical protein